MRWELINSVNGLHHWKIIDEEIFAALKYNTSGLSVRLTTNDKRLFFLEKTGVLQSRVLLKTEYSVAIGELHYGTKRSSGIFQLFDEKYAFHVTNNRLVLIVKHKKKILAGLDINNIQQLEYFELCALIFASAMVAIEYKADKNLVTSQVLVSTEKD